MGNEQAIFVKQGRLAVRNTTKLLVLLVGASAASYAVWGYALPLKVCLSLAGFVSVFLLVGYLALRANEKELRAIAAERSERTQVQEPAADSDFTVLRLPEDDHEWHTRRILVDGRPVRIRISDKPGLLEKARPYANALCEKPDELAARLKAFLGAEAQRNPLFSEEIKGLRLDSIAFMFLKEPESAEVSFTIESGGNIFFCSMVNGEFGGFRMET